MALSPYGAGAARMARKRTWKLVGARIWPNALKRLLLVPKCPGRGLDADHAQT